jgi:DNA-binding MarR family transcriptional regulator
MIKNDKYIVYFISRTKQKMTRFILKQLEVQGINDLIPSHGNILTALYESNIPLPMNEIARRIGKDKSTVTLLINKLVSLEYIEKEQNKEDKRVVFIKLTDKGLELHEKFDQISSQVFETAYQNFTDEEKYNLLSLLKKLNQNFSD